MNAKTRGKIQLLRLAKQATTLTDLIAKLQAEIAADLCDEVDKKTDPDPAEAETKVAPAKGGKKEPDLTKPIA